MSFRQIKFKKYILVFTRTGPVCGPFLFVHDDPTVFTTRTSKFHFTQEMLRSKFFDFVRRSFSFSYHLPDTIRENVNFSVTRLQKPVNFPWEMKTNSLKTWLKGNLTRTPSTQVWPRLFHMTFFQRSTGVLSFEPNSAYVPSST